MGVRRERGWRADGARSELGSIVDVDPGSARRRFVAWGTVKNAIVVDVVAVGDTFGKGEQQRRHGDAVAAGAAVLEGVVVAVAAAAALVARMLLHASSTFLMLSFYSTL